MNDVVHDALARSQIELLLSLDDGAGAALREIVGEYLTMSAEGRTELLRALQAGDAPAIGQAAHSLKGASANVGALALADVCGDIERCARHAQVEEAAALQEQFESEFSRARVALQSVASRP